MGIATATPLPIGNAVQIVVCAPSGPLVWWRVLRRTDANFVGAVDPDAVVLLDGSRVPRFTDICQLTNGTAYFYQVYFTTDGETWSTDAAPVSATPNATYQDLSPDPQELVRDRLIAGLAVEVARGTLIAPDSGVIPVFTAPFALQDKIEFPCVTVHQDNTDPGERYLGDDIFGDLAILGGGFADGVGTMASYSLNIVGTSLNSDERIILRKVLRRLILANMQVFAEFGLTQINFTQADRETLPDAAGGAVLYHTAGSFSCTAPVTVQNTQDEASGYTLSVDVVTLTGTDVIENV
jgi:hypothetical protein